MNKWIFPSLALLAVCILALTPDTPVSAQVTGAINSGDTAWMLTATGLVLLMTPGLSFFYGGMVRKKNVLSTMLQSFISLGIVSILWIVVGFSLSFGDSIGGIIGNPWTFFMFKGVGGATNAALSPTVPLIVFAMFQLKFAIITPALVTGSFAERVKFSSYLMFIVLFTLFIYAPLAHMTWHPDGLLRKMGVLDFAGGTVVHMSAGFAALAGAIILGRRKVNLNSTAHSPANIPFVLLGTGMLWFGWFGFNAGSALAANETAAMAFATTNTASAAAMIAWIFFDTLRGKKPTALGAAVAAVVGLVAITPAAGYVSIKASIVIGVIASLVSNLAVSYKTKTGIDDTLDVFPCHGVGGIVGMVLTAVFAKDAGLMFGKTQLFISHLSALFMVSLFSFGGSLLIYKLIDSVMPLRVNEEEEALGLDFSQHGEAYDESEISEIVSYEFSPEQDNSKVNSEVALS